ncbi:hypothetical protein LTR97_003966 [Elasticomyces elasticus]|uniref:Uncharacterized protein n=1 Tax=Elasticomyces elasticus TaxID=574655 RepID=A0AAN7WF24_9PEZI|nr:hypothetical protein LTR97_003966 [Elasticomyces elasticus]
MSDMLTNNTMQPLEDDTPTPSTTPTAAEVIPPRLAPQQRAHADAIMQMWQQQQSLNARIERAMMQAEQALPAAAEAGPSELAAFNVQMSVRIEQLVQQQRAGNARISEALLLPVLQQQPESAEGHASRTSHAATYSAEATN